MSNKEVALQIINFLKTSVANKEVSEDYLESIDVAIDCIADAYEVDKDDDAKVVKSDFNGKSLKDILSAFKTEKKSDVATEVPVHVESDEKALKQAEELKLEGNKAMARKDFDEAIQKYTEAIKLAPKNAVYLSNRAAAFSSLRDHESAVKDAEAAIEIDPSYSKAYSRLGLAKYALNKPKESFEAYKKGLEKEGDKPSDAMKKGYETAKRRVEEQLDLATPEQSARDSNTSSDSSNRSAPGGGFPDLSSLLGGAGGAGGAPNFAEMLNNPQLMQYAQEMMQNPGALQNLMSNPAISQMAQQFGLGGGAGGAGGADQGSRGNNNGSPDLSSLLNNPALQNLASSFMNNQGNNANNNNNNQQ